MSRSSYVDDLDNWAMIRWQGAVRSATRGKRGQAFIAELLEALEEMPNKRLAPHTLLNAEGEFCTLGVVLNKRGESLDGYADLDENGWLEEFDHEGLAHTLGVAPALVQEIMFYNDEVFDRLSPEERWQRMKKLVESWRKS